LFGFFKRTTLSDRQEAAVRKTLSNLRHIRRNRFRILACIDGSDESLIAVRTAARLAVSDDSDVIVLYVRPIDQGLHSGGLQVRLARQNMMDAGFELPGVKYLKRALEVLKEEGVDAAAWPSINDHQDAWGDPAGDNKTEYRSPTGRSVVLKLKTAPDVAVGILDQYELGPYNLMILGAPSHWRSEFKAFFGAGIVQSVSTIAPCSVLVARETTGLRGFLVCTDGSSRSMQAVRRSAVLAHVTGEPITLFSVAPTEDSRPVAEEAVANARALLKAMKIEVADAKVAVGNTVDEIVAQGAAYRVTVISDEGRSRLRRLIKGSIASEVLRRARCSVLDVR
jgi:nucleotide-binding universal stress UspA family protein